MDTVKNWVTYRMANGSYILGEYGFVETIEGFFDTIEEPVKLVKETWVLEESDIIVVEPEGWLEDEWDDAGWYDD